MAWILDELIIAAMAILRLRIEISSTKYKRRSPAVADRIRNSWEETKYKISSFDCFISCYFLTGKKLKKRKLL